jgi:hypothetical protein
MTIASASRSIAASTTIRASTSCSSIAIVLPTACGADARTSRASRSAGGFGWSPSTGSRRSRDDQYLSVPTTSPWMSDTIKKWRDRVARWRASGETAEVFSKRHGASPSHDGPGVRGSYSGYAAYATISKYEVIEDGTPTVVTVPNPKTLFPRALLHTSAIAHVVD